MSIRVLYIERKTSHFVSLEKVFQIVAESLPAGEFDTAFQNVPHGNDLVSTIKNLLFFRSKKADIFHITGHIHYIALLLPPERTILTIHDVAFLYTRKGLRRYVLKKLMLDWPLRRLRYITVVSQFTKTEILKYCKVDGEKIRVIENPLGSEFESESKPLFKKECPTILQVGTTENKNLSNLISAVNGLSCKLRIIGTLDERTTAELEENDIVFENISGLDDRAMADEYKRADIVAFCSTYEGFGLPIIEAQASKTPVITSNISPMSVVARGGAVLVDPLDPTSIRRGIVEIIENEQLRGEITETGSENIKRFDRGKVAGNYAELYREVASSIQTGG